MIFIQNSDFVYLNTRCGKEILDVGRFQKHRWSAVEMISRFVLLDRSMLLTRTAPRTLDCAFRYREVLSAGRPASLSNLLVPIASSVSTRLSAGPSTAPAAARVQSPILSDASPCLTIQCTTQRRQFAKDLPMLYSFLARLALWVD